MAIYCRLCAEIKESKQLKANISDEGVRLKLTHFYHSWVDLEASTPFQSVCSECFDKLEICWTFIQSIECAQVKLREIHESLQFVHIENVAEIKVEEESEVSLVESGEKSYQGADVDPIACTSSENLPARRQNATPSKKETDPLSRKLFDIQIKHKMEKGIKFECYLCDKRFEKFPTLKYHMEVHTLERNLGCTYCTAKFRTERQHKFHQRKHVKFICKTCEKVYPTAFKLEAHERIHNETNVRLFGCAQCDHYFYNPPTYIMHMKRAHDLNEEIAMRVVLKNEPDGTKNYVCQECGKGLASKGALERHLALHREDNNPEICGICSKSLRNKYSLKQHLQTHTTDKRFKCSQCPKGFNSKYGLAKHMDRHTGAYKRLKRKRTRKDEQITPRKVQEICRESTQYLQDGVVIKVEVEKAPEEIPIATTSSEKQVGKKSKYTPKPPRPQEGCQFYCYLCGKWFAKFPNLKYHMVVHTQAKNLKCNFCNAKFRTVRLHKFHQRNHVRYICKTCNKEFSSESRLQGHERIHNERGMRLFGCAECDYYFYIAPPYISHMKGHHGLDADMAMKVVIMHEPDGSAKRYVCEECGKSFATVPYLRQHLAVHRDDRPEKCDLCSKTFRNKFGLRNHVQQRHSTEKPFQCDQCAKCFKVKHVLTKHMELHAENVKRDFKCEFCERTFRSSYNMENHRRTHTGEKPYQCEPCGVSMTTSSRLKGHLMTQRHLKKVSETMASASNYNA